MGSRAGGRQLQLIAEEAARIVSEEGLADFLAAKTKAVKRLGLPVKSRLPTNAAVEMAVINRQSLFQTDAEKTILQQLRQSALEVMNLLAAFEPRLVGSVLKGTASIDAKIQLHVFSEDPKNVAIAMLNLKIDYQSIVRRQHEKNPSGYPGFGFDWQGFETECLVFPSHQLKVSPPSPIDGKPMARADVLQVQQLLRS